MNWNELVSQQGFAVQANVLAATECAQLSMLLPGAGPARSLLEQPWCAALARRLRSECGLPPSLLAVQCTAFEKSDAHNWLVPLHQDLSIPVAARVDAPQLRGWSVKDGVQFVQAPAALLARMLALRLHLDPCGADDGALRVVPGSHRHGILDAGAVQAARASLGETLCCLDTGGALLLRPLLLHASSNATGASRRRVLHFLFGPPDLPTGLAWHMAV